MKTHTIQIVRSGSTKMKYMDWIAKDMFKEGEVMVPETPWKLPGSILFYCSPMFSGNRVIKVLSSSPDWLFNVTRDYSIPWGNENYKMVPRGPSSYPLMTAALKLPQPCIAVGISPGEHTRTGAKVFLAFAIGASLLRTQFVNASLENDTVARAAQERHGVCMGYYQEIAQELSDEELSFEPKVVRICELPVSVCSVDELASQRGDS